jgi:excinuclease UvrABC ATPase subunit
VSAAGTIGELDYANEEAVGLHRADVEKLIRVLHCLVDADCIAAIYE